MRTTKPPVRWTSTTLEAVAQKNGYGIVDGPFGSNLPASDYTTSGIPVIRGSNLSLGTERFDASEFVFVSEQTADRLKRSICVPNDIISTKKGTLGQTGIVPISPPSTKYLLSSNQMKLSVNSDVADPLFVYYYVSSPSSREKIIRDAEATGVPKINLEYLRNFPILLPPLPIQRRIAAILGALDDKIENNRRINRTLEAMAQTLYKHWFVDFGPFQDGEFVESELGLIPAGWEVKELAKVAKVNPSGVTKRAAAMLFDS